VLKRGRKVLRLKDKHPSYCGSAVYLFLCVPTSLLQTDRTKQQSPCCPSDCQSLRVFAGCSLVYFGFWLCDSFECSPPRCWCGGRLYENVGRVSCGQHSLPGLCLSKTSSGVAAQRIKENFACGCWCVRCWIGCQPCQPLVFVSCP
jgi:hypothetical protein